MDTPEPAHAHGRRNGVLLAFAGALAGAGAFAFGLAAKRRHQPSGDDPFDEETGRGLPAVPPSPQARRKGFETEDMSGALMGSLTVGLGVAIAIAIVLMVLMLHSFQARRADAPAMTAEQRALIVPPLPHLQAHPLQDLAAVRGGEAARLAGYGWADAQHTRARIPIGAAMERTVGQSLDNAP